MSRPAAQWKAAYPNLDLTDIELRGELQYRAKVRLYGKVIDQATFSSPVEAATWRAKCLRQVEGSDVEAVQNAKLIRGTPLRDALAWYRDHGLDRSKSDAKNQLSKISFWLQTEYADWSIGALRAADLIQWRKIVLDEENIEDPGDDRGPAAKVGAQTVVHRLQTLSNTINRWRVAHKISVYALPSPVEELGVRPSLGLGRDRRILPDEEAALQTVIRECSQRPWLAETVTIAITTCMRQSEIAGLTWGCVHLDGQHPYVHLNAGETKGRRARRVPLSPRAVKAFIGLRPEFPKASEKVLPVVSGRSILRALRETITEEQFPDLRWHDFRHEGVSRLFERTDLREAEIMAITGHIHRKMMDRYTHLRGDLLAAALTDI